MYILASYNFLHHLRAQKNASEHTIRNYAIDLNSLKTFLEIAWLSEINLTHLPEKISHLTEYSQRNQSLDHLLDLNKIDRKTIRSYIDWLYKNHQTKRTIARKVSSLRSFFRYTQLQQLIAESPIQELDSPKFDRKLPPSLTYDQIIHLFEQPDTSTYLGFRDRAILELFYSSGLRVSELINLNRNDFDASQFTIKLRGKGKKERIVPITKNAAHWIKSYLSHPERFSNSAVHSPQIDSNAIFLNKHGQRLSTRSVDRKFVFYLKASGLAGNITPHTIRHTIASHWLENGMDIKIIQKLLGHSFSSTTTIYTKVSDSLKNKVYKTTHPRAK